MLQNEEAYVEMECHEFDKYGRLLVTLRKDEESDTFGNVLIREGLAYEYYGNTKKNMPDTSNEYTC